MQVMFLETIHLSLRKVLTQVSHHVTGQMRRSECMLVTQ